MSFREKVEPSIEPEVKTPPPVSVSVTKVEAPYLDYENENGKPYLVDLFDLGSHWNDRNNGFSEEVQALETYLQRQVTEGEIENSLKGIKDRIKAIEKVTGMDKESRKVIKMEILSEYVKFLDKTKDIKQNIARYDYR